MLVGRDGGLPFNDDYEPPFPFTGVLRRLVLHSNAGGDPLTAAEQVDLGAHAD
jgi:hypothetical protein